MYDGKVFGPTPSRISVLYKDRNIAGKLQLKPFFSHQNSRYLPTPSHYDISGHLYIFGRSILHSSFLFRAILKGENFTLKNNNTPRFPHGFKRANKNKNGAGQKQLVDHFVNKKETIKVDG